MTTPTVIAAVGDVERRPMIAESVEVEEVDHRAEAQPVDHVADRAAMISPMRDRDQWPVDPPQPDKRAPATMISATAGST